MNLLSRNNFSPFSRIFDRIPRRMFHGTHSKNYASLYKSINVEHSSRKLDFGKGFYLTSDFQQASEHARKRAAGEDGSEPIVFVYNVDTVYLRNNYRGLILSQLNTAWAQFIYDNRSKLFSKMHSYDYVYGGVADGFLSSLIPEMDDDMIKTGEINIELFLSCIAKFQYDQLSIHNQEIVTKEVVKLEKVVKAYDISSDYIETEAV